VITKAVVTGIMFRWRTRSLRLLSQLGAGVAVVFSAARYFVAREFYRYPEFQVVF
jgi:hypothetical protein